MKFIYADFCNADLADLAAAGAPLGRLRDALGPPVRYVTLTGEVVWMIHTAAGCADKPENQDAFHTLKPGWWDRVRGRQRLLMCWCTTPLAGGLVHPLWYLRETAALAVRIGLDCRTPRLPLSPESDLYRLRTDVHREVARLAQIPELGFYTEWLTELAADAAAKTDAYRARRARVSKLASDGPGMFVAVDRMAGASIGWHRLTGDELMVANDCPVVYRTTGLPMLVVRVDRSYVDGRLAEEYGFSVLGSARPMSERAWRLFEAAVVQGARAPAAFELAAAAAERGDDWFRVAERLVEADVPLDDILSTADAIVH